MSTRRLRRKVDCHITPILRLWLLRLLVPIGVQSKFASFMGLGNEALAEALGLQQWIGTNRADFDAKSLRTKLRLLYESTKLQLQDNALHEMLPEPLGGNIARIAKRVNLSDSDCRILEFAVMVRCEPLLEYACTELGALSSNRFFQTLSADPVSLLQGIVALSAAAELDIAEYTHIAPALDVLRPYLKQAVADGRKGVNIFVYGDPGTGKSQLAKVLDCELFEVASEDSAGDPVDGACRLRAFRVAQSFFSQRKVLFVFDEVEDVFNDGDNFIGRKSAAQTSKAWINRTLEENPVPTLWVSNSVHGMDPAFIRRFDMVFELPVPLKKQRTRILRKIASDLLDAASLTRIAESAELAPAVVAKAADVVRLINAEIGSAATAGAFELLIGNTLQAQGHSAIRKDDPSRLPDFYDPLFIHADANLADIAAGLQATKSGRLCLYGPPGSGKTAYGRWLAQQLNMPLHVKRASDLMSMYVGQNEKNIAEAFKEAANNGALLLIGQSHTSIAAGFIPVHKTIVAY